MKDAWRHFAAEFIGIFALVFIGGGAIMVTAMAVTAYAQPIRRVARYSWLLISNISRAAKSRAKAPKMVMIAKTSCEIENWKISAAPKESVKRRGLIAR